MLTGDRNFSVTCSITMQSRNETLRLEIQHGCVQSCKLGENSDFLAA